MFPLPSWELTTLIMLSILTVLFVIGVPAGFSMGLTSIVMIWLFLGPGSFSRLWDIAFNRGSDDVFLVAPLFIFMAAMVTHSGIAQAAFTAAQRWLNRLPGSLAVSSTAASTLFGAVSGSSVACALTIGSFAIPEMIRRGYDKRVAVASVATAATLDSLIPPSVALVIFGIITETSIGHLYIAGIVPGLVIAALLVTYQVGLAKLRPDLAPPAGSFTWRERFVSLGPVWGIGVLFILVMGSMYMGIATVVEAAAVGAAGATLLTMINRQMTMPRFMDSLRRSAETTAMVMFLLLGGFSLSFVAASTGMAHGISSALLGSGLPPWMILLGYNVLLILLGFPLETGTIVVITMPILFPAFIQMGFDPLWLGILTVLNGQIGTISPPAGLVLFAIKSVCPPGVTMADINKGMLPYVAVLFIGFAILWLVPGLSTWLPSQMARTAAP
jgi:C4-dicarboxylate transporter, DctM subunit